MQRSTRGQGTQQLMQPAAGKSGGEPLNIELGCRGLRCPKDLLASYRSKSPICLDHAISGGLCCRSSPRDGVRWRFSRIKLVGVVGGGAVGANSSLTSHAALGQRRISAFGRRCCSSSCDPRHNSAVQPRRGRGFEATVRNRGLQRFV